MYSCNFLSVEQQPVVLTIGRSSRAWVDRHDRSQTSVGKEPDSPGSSAHCHSSPLLQHQRPIVFESFSNMLTYCFVAKQGNLIPLESFMLDVAQQMRRMQRTWHIHHNVFYDNTETLIMKPCAYVWQFSHQQLSLLPLFHLCWLPLASPVQLKAFACQHLRERNAEGRLQLSLQE